VPCSVAVTKPLSQSVHGPSRSSPLGAHPTSVTVTLTGFVIQIVQMLLKLRYTKTPKIAASTPNAPAALGTRSAPVHGTRVHTR